jgi:tRNA A-37 threonylcarbamoyl transferase component Bud32
MLGDLVGRGAQAEVYEWGPGRVLKLFFPEYADRVDIEAEASLAVHHAGVPCPAVYGVTEHDGRRGVIFERADGPTLKDELWQGGRTPAEVGRIIAGLQLGVHACQADLRPIPSHFLGFELGHGQIIFHGDFHPGNVILSARGPLVIDWAAGFLAPRAADVAATYVSMRHHGLAESRGGVDERFREALIGLSSSYLETYCAATPEPLHDFEYYLGVFAANTYHLYPQHPERPQLEAIAARARRVAASRD